MNHGNYLELETVLTYFPVAQFPIPKKVKIIKIHIWHKNCCIHCAKEFSTDLYLFYSTVHEENSAIKTIRKKYSVKIIKQRHTHLTQFYRQNTIYELLFKLVNIHLVQLNIRTRKTCELWTEPDPKYWIAKMISNVIEYKSKTIRENLKNCFFIEMESILRNYSNRIKLCVYSNVFHVKIFLNMFALLHANLWTMFIVHKSLL